jgi:predicted transcriptional regulator
VTDCKVFTIRVPRDDARRVELVARVQGISVNDLFRQALDSYIAVLKEDDDFVSRAKAQLAQDRNIVKNLA